VSDTWARRGAAINVIIVSVTGTRRPGRPSLAAHHTVAMRARHCAVARLSGHVRISPLLLLLLLLR